MPVLASSEVEAKIKAALKILRLMYRERDPVWLELVEEMSKKVQEDRIMRGAGEKPVLKKTDVYVQEHEQSI